MPSLSSDKTLLLIGASRGLGFALAEEYLKRGWHVVATERNRTTSKLHDLLGSAEDRLEIETVDHYCPTRFIAISTGYRQAAYLDPRRCRKTAEIRGFSQKALRSELATSNAATDPHSDASGRSPPAHTC